MCKCRAVDFFKDCAFVHQDLHKENFQIILGGEQSCSAQGHSTACHSGVGGLPSASFPSSVLGGESMNAGVTMQENHPGDQGCLWLG